MNKFENKFNIGDKVYWIDLHDGPINSEKNMNYAEISIDIIESITFYKDEVRYWLSSSDDEIFEDNLVPYDSESLFKYLEENLQVNERREYDD